MRNADFYLLPVLSLDETFGGVENGIPTVRRVTTATWLDASCRDGRLQNRCRCHQ